MTMRTFKGYRPHPPEEYKAQGITNSGDHPDYEGVIFSDGTVAIRWLTTYRSHSTWNDYECFYHVHGHPEYGTVITFDDGQPAPHFSSSFQEHDEWRHSHISIPPMYRGPCISCHAPDERCAEIRSKDILQRCCTSCFHPLYTAAHEDANT